MEKLNMIHNYGARYICDFPEPESVLKLFKNDGDFALIKDKATEYTYILNRKLDVWSKIVEEKDNNAEWVMSQDDFENGWGYKDYPHCSNCHRGVYKHDAGNYCPFCGKPMKNPITQ